MSVKHDVVVDGGAPFTWTVFYKQPKQPDGTKPPVDLSGFTARLQVRSGPGGTLYADLTTAGGQITIDGALGRVDATVDDTITAAWTFEKAEYELQIYDGTGTPTSLVKGNVGLSPGIIS